MKGFVAAAAMRFEILVEHVRSRVAVVAALLPSIVIVMVFLIQENKKMNEFSFQTSNQKKGGLNFEKSSLRQDGSSQVVRTKSLKLHASIVDH
jgi:hypothetical protein